VGGRPVQQSPAGTHFFERETKLINK
jgi:hypothetical protein